MQTENVSLFKTNLNLILSGVHDLNVVFVFVFCEILHLWRGAGGEWCWLFISNVCQSKIRSTVTTLPSSLPSSLSSPLLSSGGVQYVLTEWHCTITKIQANLL